MRLETFLRRDYGENWAKSLNYGVFAVIYMAKFYPLFRVPSAMSDITIIARKIDVDY